MSLQIRAIAELWLRVFTLQAHLFEHRFLRRLQQAAQAAQDEHLQDDIARHLLRTKTFLRQSSAIDQMKLTTWLRTEKSIRVVTTWTFKSLRAPRSRQSDER